MTDGQTPASRVRGMLNGYVETQLLYVAAALGLADALHAGALDIDALVGATGADRDSLHRVMRGLANIGIVIEGEDGRFALTETGQLLRSDMPGSLRTLALLTGEQEYRAWGELLYTVRTGQTAFDHVYGEPFFARLDRDRSTSAHFNAFMDHVSARIAAALLRAYDFSAVRTVVDVGGGRGTLLTALLAAHPHLRGVLFDRPAVSREAEAALAAAELAGRRRFIAGDFFTSVPEGGDLYILSQVLHDWDDEQCRRILSNCRRAMGPEGKLLIVERLLPERVVPPTPVVTSDLHMLTLTGGRERAEAEYVTLLAGSGFALARVIPLVAGWSLIEGALE